MVDSVRVKLTLWYTGVLALILLLFSAGVYLLMERKLSNRLDANLRTGVEGMTRLFIHEKEEGETDQYSAGSVLRKSYFPRQAVAFYDARGNYLGGQKLRGELSSPLPETLYANGDAGIQFHTLEEAYGNNRINWRVASFRITAPVMQSPCYVLLSQPLDDLLDELGLLRGIFYIAVPAALALAGLSGWLLARKSLAPVVAMSETARRIGAENLDDRLPVANPRDELGKLAAAFNELLARLHEAFAQQRQFMADASHELRTPVSIIRSASEVTLKNSDREASEYREALGMTGEQARRLTRIVEDMFTLARADAGRRELKPRDFYLDELVAETARAAGVLAECRGVRIECSPGPEMRYRGDEDLLRQMLLNLLDNAIKYTPGGGEISLRLVQEESSHIITVADTGIGIPAEAQPHIFERFYRVDKARSRAGQIDGGGAGLGLSIARWIAEAHKGRIDLSHSDERGSTFVIVLPASSQGFEQIARLDKRISTSIAPG